MRSAIWYFDFVSPFAYIGLHRLKELPAELAIEFRPVLFAGLLGHWGQKGPAELPSKRRYTYRWAPLTLVPSMVWSLTELVASPGSRAIAAALAMAGFLALAAIVAVLRTLPASASTAPGSGTCSSEWTDSTESKLAASKGVSRMSPTTVGRS